MSQASNRHIYGVDFDGTLAYPSKMGEPLGEPIPENIVKLKELMATGYSIIIFTARPWSEYEKLKIWFSQNMLPVEAIVCGKPYMYRFVDDRAINAREASWL